MKIHSIQKGLVLSIICLFFNTLSNAQTDKISIEQDPKFEQLLQEKRKNNTTTVLNDRYKIQIYNGDIESSKKILNEFKREFKKTDGTIEFFTPSYKVWIGNFKTRMEAEKMLLDIKKKYPNAFLIKPSRQ
jgi:hypothetical protein